MVEHERSCACLAVFARERYRAMTVVPTIEAAEAWLRLQPLD
jgi:hypothetical protein